MYKSHYVYLVNYLHYSKRFTICKNYFAFFRLFFMHFFILFCLCRGAIPTGGGDPVQRGSKGINKALYAAETIDPFWV